MKSRWLYILVAMIFLLCLPIYATATSATATQKVTLKVEPFAVISLVGTGEKNSTWLVVDGAAITTPSKELEWTTNLEGMKVTVQSNLATDQQDYTLRVRAVSLNSKGTSNDWVVVNEEPSILITGITREIGGCFLEYDALSKVSEKPRRQEHIITYTITE
jgi:hypothetical protein